MRLSLLMIAMVASAGCSGGSGAVIDASRGRKLDPDAVQWTEQERQAEVATVEVRRGSWSSEHLLRLRGSEKPHVHQRHDVTVTAMRGRIELHLGDQVFEMRPGDVASIPHGTPHWARNLADEASIGFVVFSPPFDGQDSTPIENQPANTRPPR